MNNPRSNASRTAGHEPVVKRAGHHTGQHPEDSPYITGQEDDLEEDDSYYTPRVVGSSARRYTTSDRKIIQQGNKRIVVHYGPPPIKQQRHPDEQRPHTRASKQPHWLVFVGIGMCIMVITWFFLSNFGTWWQNYQDDLHYGRPRTFQIDTVVGHNDSPVHPSHFIVINLNRHIEIIEMPGGDTSQARIYNGPILLGNGQDLTPVTISFQDLTRDGKPDMLIHVSGQTIVMINENGQFRPARLGEVNL